MPTGCTFGTREGMIIYDLENERDFQRKSANDGPEHIVYGNVPFPLEADYYFEVTLVTWNLAIGTLLT